MVALTSPSIWELSTKSALTSVKLSLPDSDSLASKLRLSRLLGCCNEQGDYDANEPVESESDLEKSQEIEPQKSQPEEKPVPVVDDFSPPFVVGPAKVNFSEKEFAQFRENDGPIFRNFYRAGKGEKTVELSKSAYAKNLTPMPNDVIVEANKQKPSFVLSGGSNPEVLIMHTHATEAYELKEKNFYSAHASSHSQNSKATVVGVGDQIVSQLQQSGFSVLHDKTLHDVPSYNGAYDRSNNTIRNHIEKNPTIKVVLDIHRDGIQNDKGQRFAPVVKIEGRKAAQIMIVAGCDNGTMHYPNYRQNLAFACFLQRQIGQDYPGLMRPLVFKCKHYNQSLTPGTLLIEIGSNSNSVDEAMYAGWLFGKSLANALSKLKK